MAPEMILLIVLGAAFTLYAVLGGADFGAGVWEFNTAFLATEKERNHIYRAVGPVWEANHVWLIFVVVVLFNGFPPAFAGLFRALWLPLLLGLAGIVFRGAAFAFRSSYATGAERTREREIWSVVFALASTAAPFFLGACVGAVLSGSLQVTPSGGYQGDYLMGWLSPLSLFSGFFAVGGCAYLAAVYMAREAANESDPELADHWRRRALALGAWMGILALTGLALIALEAPHLWIAFDQRGWPLVILSAACGVIALYSLSSRWFTAATLFSAGAVGSVIWGWMIAQYPILVPPSITVADAKGPNSVLWFMIIVVGLGAFLLIPSLLYLFTLFKSKSAARLGA